jgi:hypothetical protein
MKKLSVRRNCTGVKTRNGRERRKGRTKSFIIKIDER